MHLCILFGCIWRCISEISHALIYEILLFIQLILKTTHISEDASPKMPSGKIDKTPLCMK